MKTTSGNRIMLKPYKAPVSLGLQYQSKLVRMVKSMNKEIYKAIKQEYGEISNQLGMDNDVVTKLNNRLKWAIKRYEDFFSTLANPLASEFVYGIDSNNFKFWRNQLAEKGITIRPDANYVKALNQNTAMISENVELITNLPQKMYEQIHGDVMRSISTGGSLKEIKDNLIKRGIQTEKRARFIARDQLFKATGVINNQRMINNGIDKAIWKHSKGDKVPRQSHLQADGKVFETIKGCLIDGEYILPGEKINCTCYSSPFIEI